MSLAYAKAAAERAEIERMLKAHDGNQTHAAKALGITPQWMRKRLVALFTPEERAEMAARWGWRGTKQPTH